MNANVLNKNHPDFFNITNLDHKKKAIHKGNTLSQSHQFLGNLKRESKALSKEPPHSHLLGNQGMKVHKKSKQSLLKLPSDT